MFEAIEVAVVIGLVIVWLASFHPGLAALSLCGGAVVAVGLALASGAHDSRRGSA